MSSKSKAPKVSIVTISYNQEGYIRQALDSFVMQKTDFDFEVVVADDGSTDKTQEIIKEYAQKYPEIFRPILRKKNIGAANNSIDSLRAAKGKYIALCEGDDYWTDPEKIQRQADFLDKNPGYALVFHPVKIFFENQKTKDEIYPDAKQKSRFNVTELIKWNFIQTNSIMYRRQDYGMLPNNILPLDWYLHLYHAQFGKIGFIDRVMSAYRRHEGGIWWNAHSNQDELWKKYGLMYFGMYREALKLFEKDYANQDAIYEAISELMEKFITVDNNQKTALLEAVLQENPGNVPGLVKGQSNQLKKKQKEIQELLAALQQKDIEIARIISQKDTELHALKQKEQELNRIKSSKVWKMRNKAAKLTGRDVV